MKILIVGSSGFIGRFLVQKLAEKGYQVAGMDVAPSKASENGYRFISGDILDLQSIKKAAQGVDAIINLAAEHHDFGISRLQYFRVNVGGTQNILDAAAELGIKRFIFFSSVAVYGNHKAYTTEMSLTHPVNDYGESKLAAEERIREWAKQDLSRQAVIIRPTVVFGPENYANMYNLINSIYKKRFLFVGKGDNIKSVAYVENLVDATLFLLERIQPGIEVYNYADYPQMSTDKIVQTITRYLSYHKPRLKVPLKPALAAASIFDVLGKITGYNFPITANRIKKFNAPTQHMAERIRALGFKPRVSLPEGFRRMVHWYLNNGKK